MKLTKQLFFFGVVGATSALCHYLVVVLLVTAKWNPLNANVVAFLVAYNVSYLGQRHFTFSHTTASHRAAFTKFFIVATMGFALNQTLFGMFLNYTSLPYYVSLVIVLVVVAIPTYLLGRCWSFK